MPDLFNVSKADHQAVGLLAANLMQDLAEGTRNIRLFRGKLDDLEVTFITVVSPVGDASSGIVPLAIVCDDAFITRITLEMPDGSAPYFATGEVQHGVSGTVLNNVILEGISSSDRIDPSS